MSDKRDYYEVLGVEKNADDKELKQAFRILARRYHPDKNDAEDAESRFKEIQEAYAVLSDPEKRRQYDRFGHNVPGGSPFGAGGFNINLEDILGGDFSHQYLVEVVEVLEGVQTFVSGTKLRWKKHTLVQNLN